MSTPNDPRQSLPDSPDRVDYTESHDVTEVHAAIQREGREPSAEVTPMPLWLTAICGIAMVWAGTYFGVFHGGLSASVFNERESSPGLLFPASNKTKGGPAEGQEKVSLAQEGKGVYAQCQSCHQPNGAGLAGQFPPLIKSDWVVGSEKRLIAILLKGLNGPLNVNGVAYNGQMPAWDKTLSDRKIAAVASYIRQSWGNQAPDISPAKVAAARKEFAEHAASFTEPELLQISADATLPDEGGTAPAGQPVPAAATPASAAAPPTAPAPVAASALAAAPPRAAPVALPSATSPAATPPTATPVAASPEIMAKGKTLYMGLCVVCHQPTGTGLPMVFPPLTKSDYVNGSAKRFAAMILKGVSGPITVEGKPYNSIMPGQEALLDDEKIAAVLSFVRGSFGNSSGVVTPDLVAATRKEHATRATPWTEAELLAWKDDGAPVAPVATPPASAPVVAPVPAAQTAPTPALAPAAEAPAPSSTIPPLSPTPLPAQP